MKSPKPAGYSGTPLHKKLGLKPGLSFLLENAPENYLQDTLVDLSPEVNFVTQKEDASVDVVQGFFKENAAFEAALLRYMKTIHKGGMIWISWPKKASKVATDLDEGKIRGFALRSGLVDVKVCAVDKTWSGLKLVYRLKDR